MLWFGPRDELGRRGERLAERYLRRAGMKVLARRFRAPGGELDLVMRDGDVVVFVEVKTQRDERFGEPEARVGRDKRARMARAARLFVRRRRLEDAPCRFDIVAVVLGEGAAPLIRHVADAFDERGRA